MEIQHAPDALHGEHLAEARRVLALPLQESGLHWHPFGVYVIPMAKRVVDGVAWSRRLHVWHPLARPVGESSPYGVHTHSGTARSHVVVGALHHHLFEFAPDPDGKWQEATLGDPIGRSRLVGRVQATTSAGMVHTLPPDTPHAVTKPEGLAVSLFEQVGKKEARPFTTWQRLDVPAEALLRQGPVPVGQVREEALMALDVALHRVGV